MLKSENDTVWKMGIKTGRTQGDIKNVNSSPSYDCHNLNSCAIQTDCNITHGDSGGPAYWFDDSYDANDRSAYVLYMRYKNANWICDGVQVREYSGGVAAWKIHRQGYDPVNGVEINPGTQPNYP